MNTRTGRISLLTKLAIGGAVVLAAAAAFGDTADAPAALDQVTVQSSPVETVKHIGRTSSGIPIDEISLSVYVKTEGLDLGTKVGLKAMEKRIDAAAHSVCNRIDRDYPFSETTDAECVIAAARPAIARVREFALGLPG